MDTCDVKLTIARSGPAGAQNRGDTVTVGLLEAGRMLRSGQIEKPAAATLKAIAAAEAEARGETADKPAAQPADKPADKPADAETADKPGA